MDANLDQRLDEVAVIAVHQETETSVTARGC